MERLTKRLYDGTAWFNHTPEKGITTEAVIEKLARYEDTGMAPEKLQEVLALRNSCIEVCDHTGCGTEYVMTVLEAAKERRIFVLPKNKVDREMFTMAIKSAQAALDKMIGKDVR